MPDPTPEEGAEEILPCFACGSADVKLDEHGPQCQECLACPPETAWPKHKAIRWWNRVARSVSPAPPAAGRTPHELADRYDVHLAAVRGTGMGLNIDALALLVAEQRAEAVEQATDMTWEATMDGLRGAANDQSVPDIGRKFLVGILGVMHRRKLKVLEEIAAAIRARGGA